MNCPNCGSIIPFGVNVCPVCGTNVGNTQGYAGYTQQPNPYSQGFDPTVYPQYGAYNQGAPMYGNQQQQQTYPGGQYGFDPTTGMQSGYMQGYDVYQQTYPGYQPARDFRTEFITALGNLPRVIRGMLVDPGETLHGMMERGDVYTGAVVAVLSLLLTFLTAILMSRGAVYNVFMGLSSVFGLSMANDAASMNQGVNYIAGRMATSVGGIAALSQLIALLIPAAVALVYLCVMKKVRFSYLLASNMVAIVTLPSIAASMVCMLVSLLSPYLGLVVLMVGEIASYVLLCSLVVWVANLPEQQWVSTKIIIISAAELLKLLIIWLVSGALASLAMNTVSSLVNSMGSLL